MKTCTNFSLCSVFYSDSFKGKSHEIKDKKEIYPTQYVACRHNGDNLWYRAQIVRSAGDKFEVFFIDYGATDYVPKDRLWHLALHFTTFPMQAFPGKMYGILPHPGDQWSDESTERFLALIKGIKFHT